MNLQFSIRTLPRTACSCCHNSVWPPSQPSVAPRCRYPPGRGRPGL